MLSGDNGILQRVTDAKIKSDEAQIKERIQLAELAARADTQGKLTYSNLNIELTKEFGEKGTGYNISDESENPWIITVESVQYEIFNIINNSQVAARKDITEAEIIPIGLTVGSTTNISLFIANIAELEEFDIMLSDDSILNVDSRKFNRHLSRNSYNNINRKKF